LPRLEARQRLLDNGTLPYIACENFLLALIASERSPTRFTLLNLQQKESVSPRRSSAERGKPNNHPSNRRQFASNALDIIAFFISPLEMRFVTLAIFPSPRSPFFLPAKRFAKR